MSKVRVLYDFEGEPNSSEMTIRSGEQLTVTNTNVGDGWWEGMNSKGQRGLFPAAYVEAIPITETKVPPPPSGDRYDQPADPWEADSDFDSDNESTYQEIQTPTQPADSNYYNRGQLPPPPTDDNISLASTNAGGPVPIRRPPKIFSKSGDSYILGTSTVTVPPDERVYIYQTNIGYMWKQLEPGQHYTVSIASPKTESKFGGIKTFTAYQLTPSNTNIVVSRRYKQFDWLHLRLVEKFSLIPIPPLPAKQQTGRFDESFIEHRQAQLQEFMNWMCSHPILSTCEVWRHFITCTDDKRWKAGKRRAEKDNLVGVTYCAAICAPEKQLLQSQVDSQLEACNSFAHQMSGAVKAVMGTADDIIKKYQTIYKKDFQRVGDAFSELAKALYTDERRLTTDTALSEAVGHAGGIYISIAQLFGEQAKNDWTPLSDRFHLYRGIVQAYPDIMAEHHNAMQKKKECERLTSEQKMSNGQLQEVNRRCDVMSYAVMAEMNQFRVERDQNLKQTMHDFLSGQIDFYKKIVEKLEEARRRFE